MLRKGGWDWREELNGCIELVDASGVGGKHRGPATRDTGEQVSHMDGTRVCPGH